MSAVRYFAIRDDNLSGSGTQDNPYNGSTDTLLDGVLSNATLITDGMTLIFGPGVFQTKGLGAQAAGWSVRNQTRIIGSGINSTVLQLLGAQPAASGTARVAIISSSGIATDVEISDLTLDVNLSRQPKAADGSNALICGQGVLIYGNNIVIRRVRVINWGTYTSLQVANSLECFPLYIEAQDPVDSPEPQGSNVLEDCIVEYPALSPAREATLTNVHTSIFGTTPKFLRIRSTCRNNYINGDAVAGTRELATDVASIAYASSVMTVATRWAASAARG
jgi:hypothetical protein